ncbi:hypothetical protein FACS189421_12650 [Bacteroidia bacterium]|nr:hypothetical protein FACS189421_12650 [Bacteroidia bacterium]GHT03647.1 hypothetical protein FACS189423_05030 [Bacteroidia bacterium]
MKQTLYYNTVNHQLLSTLKKLMDSPVFNSFRLVGGTALSLQLGHRESIDIDLFTDENYGTIDFDIIDNYFKSNFVFVETSPSRVVGMGKPYYIGDDDKNFVKVDLFYTDAFIRSVVETDGIRLAHIEDIIAMKIDVIQRQGRKKDFWDIHELMSDYSIEKMISLHEERYPYSHDKEAILSNFTLFQKADEENNPMCLRGKYWEIIKFDFIQALQNK